MDSTKEKPTYDAALYYKPKTPTKAPAKAPNTPPNKQGEYAAPQPKAKDESTAMWTQSQEDYADDYIRRLRERYADRPENFTELVEQLRKRQVEGIDRRGVWLEVCRIMRDAPDLRDEFKNFMAPGDGPF